MWGSETLKLYFHNFFPSRGDDSKTRSLYYTSSYRCRWFDAIKYARNRRLVAWNYAGWTDCFIDKVILDWRWFGKCLRTKYHECLVSLWIHRAMKYVILNFYDFENLKLNQLHLWPRIQIHPLCNLNKFPPPTLALHFAPSQVERSVACEYLFSIIYWGLNSV